ncbi:MAG TPA: DegT/DnrJ/EryC1/StrS family aminotransferase [Candidatus Omnitrophota bacterium]|nr:DegT/DnrJ/EryC1/StrS family aminotransferase [Candidatus Omnitrophota bacterium]
MKQENEKINVTRTYLPDRGKLSKYINKVYDSGWITNNGEFCKELELRLKNYLGVRNLILVANGTLALQLAYKALDVKEKAITTPFSFVATTNSLLWERIEPVFADIDPRKWTISPEQIEKNMTPEITGIVPVHVFGNACDVEDIKRIADKNGLKVIYDAAHAFGVKYKGKSLFEWGDVSVLSFHATKLFHTIEGGAVITADDEIADKIRLFRNFGITGQESVKCVGINAKMNEFQAIMGLCVLDDIEEISEKRKKVWMSYYNKLKDIVNLQEINKKGSNNYGYFPILFKNETTAIKAQKKLNNKNIFPRRYFYPSLDTLPYVDHGPEMAVSRDVASRVLCLPMHGEITEQTIAVVCKEIESQN